MEKRSGDPLRIFVLLYRERVRLSSPQRGKKSLVQRTFFRDFIKTAHRGCGAQYSLSRNLVAFAPAGAKKVRSFSSATCAAKKILLGLQTCAPAASGGQRVRCSQAANPFVKKYYFLTDTRPPRPFGRGGYRDFRSWAAYARFHLTPCGVSSSTMPSALSSSRMRSASAQFLALRAA